jgi:hypothetical protein
MEMLFVKTLDALRPFEESYSYRFNLSAGDIMLYTAIAPDVFILLLNVTTTFIILHDIKKFHIKTHYILPATLLFRPIGVFAFLFFLFFKNESDSNKK